METGHCSSVNKSGYMLEHPVETSILVEFGHVIDVREFESENSVWRGNQQETCKGILRDYMLESGCATARKCKRRSRPCGLDRPDCKV